jgi:hypothetical protein
MAPHWGVQVCQRGGRGNRVVYRSQFLDRDGRAHHAQAKIRQLLCEPDGLDPEEWDFRRNRNGCASAGRLYHDDVADRKCTSTAIGCHRLAPKAAFFIGCRLTQRSVVKGVTQGRHVPPSSPICCGRPVDKLCVICTREQKARSPRTFTSAQTCHLKLLSRPCSTTST